MVTSNQIADTLAGRTGPVSQSFRFESSDHQGASIADLTPTVEKCTISLQNFRTVTRTAQFKLNKNQLPAEFDTAGDHIKVTAEVLVAGEIVIFPLGIFHLDAPKTSFTPNDEALIDVAASDLSIHLQEETTDSPYTVTSSETYTSAVEVILDNILVTHSIPSSGSTLPVDITWAPGTPFMTIVNELLFGINYHDIYVDGLGVFRSRPRINPAFESSSIAYSTESEPKMIVPPFTLQDSNQLFPNRAVVLIDDPRRTPTFELRENTDGRSSISIQNAPTRLVKFTGSDKARIILDSTTAGNAADYELQRAASSVIISTLVTMFDPRRDVHEFYTVTIEDEIISDFCLVHGWTLTTEVGQPMTHQISQILDFEISEPI